MISSSILPSAVLLACFLPLCLGQAASCTNRCGETYYRGHVCHCDYDCLIHDECCKDYEMTCTTSVSCKGRCGETFRRGRQCNCDPECFLYNQCCPDYEAHCGKVTTTRAPATTIPTNKNPKKEPPKKVIVDEAAEKGLIHTERPPLEHTYSKDLFVDEFVSTYFPPLNQQELQEQRDEAIDSVTPEIPRSLAKAYSPGPMISLENMSGYEPFQSDRPGGVSAQDSMSPSSETPARVIEEREVMEQNDVLLSRNQTESTQENLNNETFSITPAAVSPTHIAAMSPDGSYSHKPSKDITERTNPDIKVNDEASSSHSKLTRQTPQGLKELTPCYHEDDTPSSTQPSKQDHPSPKPSKEGIASDKNLEMILTTDTSPAIETSNMPRPGCNGDKRPPDSDNSANTEPTESMSTEHSKSPTPIQSLAFRVPSTNTRLKSDMDKMSAKSSEASPTGAMETEVPSLRTNAPPQPTALDLIPQPTATPPQSNNESQTPSFGIPTMAPLDTIFKPVQPVQTDGTKDSKGLPTVNPPEYLADDNDTNLCSGGPINGLTTLQNGTVVVFRGHYFWMLDANRVPGPARGITEVWGIPSPIDTIFTRCNCQRKTYIFKGYRYWRFENDVMDSGYPKTISDGFSGLSGKITAALSVPQISRRPESVFFFKRGGLVQRYSYRHGASPNCSKKHLVFTVRHRLARQAENGLKEIKITWQGFPSLVTSAISIPSPRKPDGYNYYIFSRTKFYNIKVDDDIPTLVSPVAAVSQQNSAKSFFKCP